MTKRKRTKGQTTIYKTLQRKQKIEQQELHRKWWWTDVQYTNYKLDRHTARVKQVNPMCETGRFGRICFSFPCIYTVCVEKKVRGGYVL